MKKLKTFEDYAGHYSGDSQVSDWANKMKNYDLPDINDHIEPTEENFVKLMKFQKENGGVIKIPAESKDIAMKYGYTIKNKVDDEVMKAVQNFEVVDFVVCDEDQEPYVIK